MDGALQLTDTLTGELVDRDFRSLDDIATETRELFTAIDRDEWKIGANLAEARAKFGNDDDRGYGGWISGNFPYIDQKTLWNYRVRFQVFGQRREEIAHIPKSAQYLLAAPDADNYRDEVIEKLRDAEAVSIADVREAMKEARRLPPVAPASGTYNVIVIDPPWEMQKIERDVAPNQVGFDYPTMAEDELAVMSLPAADDCHLFCWTTHKHLPMSLRLLEAWGFRYVLTMVWHKPGGFQPFGLPQYNCEFAVYGRKGTPQFIDTKAFNTCFDAPRREHSRKPDEFYDVIRRVTGGTRIDMFSRENRDGFETWGNEAGKFTEAV